MKKGLSVLLIAAALFGFYGGATNLNDVLACKDYFESASGASDDMQRLEDGLNQLKDNEQAYLDGQVALAEGEKTLADGYATLADGEKQYADGLAAYKAAPGQLADGEKALKDLAKLIKGLKTAQKHGTTIAKADKYWHDAYTNALVPGRKKIEGVVGQKAQLLGLIDMLNQQKPGTIVSRFSNTDQSYPNFDKQVLATKENFLSAAKVLTSYKTSLFGIGKLATATTQAATAYGKAAATYQAAAQAYAAEQTDENKEAMDTAKEAMVAAKGPYDQAKAILEGAAAQFDSPDAYGPLNDQLPGIAPADMQASVTVLTTAIENAAKGKSDKEEVVGATDDGPVKAKSFGIIANALSGETGEKLGGTIDSYVTMLDNGKPGDEDAGFAQQFEQWDNGYQTLAHAKDGETSKAYPDDLASKKSGVPYAFKNMVTNKTIKAAIKKYDPSLMKILKKYTGNKLKNDSMAEFDKDITYLGKTVIPRALKVLAKVKADGENTLAEGYKSYKEAPGKLADARQQLADGRAQLADGEKQLADGKAQLAQYEDGEQQVRDGLATLVGTQPMGDVQGIADRIGNDTDFDNGDEHLELDEGLSAVQAGKGYASDLTAAVTDEIMSRAIATGLLIGAGVLAVLAALLSFLKKNKGAGVLAVLAAAAGCVGAFMGNAAGMQFSSIAGSTMGATPWVAAGILAAVAAVHAIVHFTVKKEA